MYSVIVIVKDNGWGFGNYIVENIGMLLMWSWVCCIGVNCSVVLFDEGGVVVLFFLIFRKELFMLGVNVVWIFLL